MTTDWDARFAAFRAANLPIWADLAGVRWEYLDRGAGPPAGAIA